MEHAIAADGHRLALVAHSLDASVSREQEAILLRPRGGSVKCEPGVVLQRRFPCLE